MSDDLRSLVRQAVLEPEGEPPVAELVRRARARRTRRIGAFGAVPGALVLAAVLVLPRLGAERVDLAPGDTAAGPGWPVEARYELLDLTPDVAERLETARLTIEEFAGSSWDEWVNVTVSEHEVGREAWEASPGGEPRDLGASLGGVTVQAHEPGRRASLTPGDEVAVDRREPFAALRVARALTLDWQPSDDPLAPNRLFQPGALEGAAGWPVPDELVARLAAALGVDPQSLRAQARSEVGRTFTDIRHAPTGMPLFQQWQDDIGLVVTTLRVTHVRFGAEPAPAPVTVTLDPAVVSRGGEVTAMLENNTSSRFGHGLPFELARQDGHTWRQVAAKPDGEGWDDPAFSLGPGERTTDVLRTEHLEPGRYRYTKRFTDEQGDPLEASGTFSVTESQDPSALEGRTFVSVSVEEGGQPRALVEGSGITVSFTRPWNSFSAGCNEFGGLTVEPHRLVKGPGGFETFVGCSGELHAQDLWLRGFFGKGPAWHLDGSRLRLEAEGTVIILEEQGGVG